MIAPVKISNSLIYIIIAGAALGIGVYLGLQGESDTEYVERIARHRDETDRFMQASANSPLPEASRRSFTGLNYFPADSAYVVEAMLVPLEGQAEMLVSTSTGNEERYIQHSYAEFEWDGGKHRLLLLQSPGRTFGNRLFLAFTDQTSGTETYGGGRYLEVYPQTETRATIDFNMAYNPYCVYDPRYSCALPPSENHLDFPVLAGEKMYTGS
jgi:uncharacterized protein (DUF1684 family)